MIRVNGHFTPQHGSDLAALPDPRVTIHHSDADGTLLTARIAAPKMADAIDILASLASSFLPDAIVSNGQAVALIPVAQAS